ncbi:MAG: methyl-coenzyme M reductase family protein [Methanomassiliicoccus sp.]|nr:methyl-coenzyme M reductase family protein [Methanomassiliicoccus sp.]
MYEVLMYDGGVYRVNELYELVEDVGGFVIQKTQIQVQILVTMAVPEEERPSIEAKTRELGGKIVNVPLAGTEVAVVAPTLGRHHMPHPTCDIAEQLRRLGAITVVMGLARGKGRRTSQISADEKAIIEEYDAAVFVLGNFKDCILEHKIHLFEDIQTPVVAVCGPQIPSLPNCEAIVCGVGRKVERMRREEEIGRLDDVSVAIEKVVKDKRRVLEEDPLFVHPAEVKDRITELEPVQRSLRPAPVVLHLDGLRVKIPYKEWKDQIADVQVYGHRLGDIATISDSRLGGSTLIRIKTQSEVEDHDRRKTS